MQNLPPELLLEIISHLDTEPDGHECGPTCPTTSDLYNLCLTSRSFHHFTTPILYAHDAAHAGQAILHGAHMNNTDIISYSQSLGGDISQSRRILLPAYSPRAAGTPLHLAVKQGHHDMVRFLVRSGANMNATGMALCACDHNDHPYYPCSPWSPLHLALCGDRPEIAEYLILQGASLVLSREDVPPSPTPRRHGSVALLRPYRGIHALEEVAKKMNVRMLRFIVRNAGQGIEARKCNRPFHRVARVTDDPDTLEFMDTLLVLGAQLYPPGFRGGRANGRVPLDLPFIDWARHCEAIRMIPTLRHQHEAVLQTFLSFLARNHGEHLQVLRDRCLELWMDRGPPDLSSSWAFLYATFGALGAGETNPELVREYAHRAIFDAKLEPLGPMMLPDVLNFLPQLGYNVQALLEPMDELLLGAADGAMYDECEWFLARGGADVNCQNGGGETPLHLAAKCGSLSVVELLLRHGAELERRDGTGDTAERVAKRYRRKDILALLSGLREGEEERRRRMDILGGGCVKECEVMVGVEGC